MSDDILTFTTPSERWLSNMTYVDIEHDGIIMSECSDFTAEQLDFVLEMCEQSVVKKPRKHKAKDVKVQYRCKDTVDWVDMLNSEDSLGEGLKVIHNPVNSIGKSWLKEILPDDCIIHNNGLIDGVDVKIISWDEGVDITNDLLDLTIEDNKTLKQHLSEYRNTEHGSDFDSFKLF